MAELHGPWPSALLAVLLLAALGTWLPLTARRLHRLVVVASGAALLLSAAPLVELLLFARAEARDPWLGLGTDQLSALLLPFGALSFAVVQVVRPRAEITPRPLRAGLLAEAGVLAFFLARGPLALGLLWLALIALLLGELRGGRHPAALAVAGRYLGLSAALFALGAGALAFASDLPAAAAPVGAGLLLVAAMIRKGIFPFHSWMPDLFDQGPFGAALLFSVPQVAAYALARLVVPRAPAGLLLGMGALSLLTAVYGAAAFVAQRDARRAFGYFFMSQSALVMAGLECSSIEGLVGGLGLWLSSGLALVGMGATVWLLEARRGRLAIDRLHGGYRNKPLLATAFLLFGLASVGFPGTLGFVAEELLIDGAVTQFPRVGFAVVLASSLSAIGVLRMYFALFCGAGEPRAATGLRPRERLAVFALVLLLLLGGLVPQPIVSLETRVAEQLILARCGL
jgi:NADH-quinone oxidoreductase subunit M